MESCSNVSDTLDLISFLSVDRSINESYEIQSSEDTVSETMSTRRNNNDTPDDHMPKKVRRKEMVFSATMVMSTPLRNRIFEIGGFDIRIVVQKQLQNTDVNKNHSRLIIPLKKLLNDFTTQEENKYLLSQKDEDQNNKNGLKVLIVDPVLRESVIGLKLWKIGSRNYYCLVSEWISLAQQNSLESGDYIQLWSFRKNGFDGALAQTVTSNLCFAMVNLDISEGIFKFI